MGVHQGPGPGPRSVSGLSRCRTVVVAIQRKGKARQGPRPRHATSLMRTVGRVGPNRRAHATRPVQKRASCTDHLPALRQSTPPSSLRRSPCQSAAWSRWPRDPRVGGRVRGCAGRAARGGAPRAGRWARCARPAGALVGDEAHPGGRVRPGGPGRHGHPGRVGQWERRRCSNCLSGASGAPPVAALNGAPARAAADGRLAAFVQQEDLVLVQLTVRSTSSSRPGCGCPPCPGPSARRVRKRTAGEDGPGPSVRGRSLGPWPTPPPGHLGRGAQAAEQ
jgi:hypothetical protein